MSLISVLLIAGTGRPYLADAIRSLTCQDLSDWEAIVVEACADAKDTENVFRQIEEVGDSRVRVLSYEGDRRFPPYAGRKWNVALAHATGSFVSFLDDDDLKEENWFSAMLAPFLADSKLVTTLCDVISIDVFGNKQGVMGASLDQKALLTPHFVTTGQMMIRRDVLQALGGFDAELPCSEDYDLALRLSVYPWVNVRTVNSLKRDGDRNASCHEDVIMYTRNALARIAKTRKLGFSMFPWFVYGNYTLNKP